VPPPRVVSAGAFGARRLRLLASSHGRSRNRKPDRYDNASAFISRARSISGRVEPPHSSRNYLHPSRNYLHGLCCRQSAKWRIGASHGCVGDLPFGSTLFRASRWPPTAVFLRDLHLVPIPGSCQGTQPATVLAQRDVPQADQGLSGSIEPPARALPEATGARGHRKGSI